MNVVLVGCGAISDAWLKPLQTMREFELVGFVDVLEDNAKKRQQEYAPRAVVSTNLEHVLAQTQPEIVFDCTIPAARFEVVTTALQHGCHVVAEKPMAESLEQAQVMIEVARKAGKLFVVMQNWRYTRNIRRLKRFLEAGHIGNVTTLNADFYVGAHFGGFREVMPHVLLKDMAIHTFDAARFLTGQNATGVYATEWNPEGSWYSRDASAAALFDMTGNITFNYRGSWCAEGFRTPWESEWRIIGTKGSVCWNGNAEMRCEVVLEQQEFELLRPYQALEIPFFDDINTSLEGHGAVIHDFLTALKTQTQPETICTDNFKSLAMVYGAIESLEQGKKVAIRS
jgi:predicted dehydrogenase